MRIRITRPDERTSPARGRGHRRDSIGIQVRYAIAIVVALIAAYAATQAYEAAHTADKTAQALKAGLARQTSNRRDNVAQWCGAIDALEADLSAYVARFSHAPQLHLRHLDCKALERQTLASTKPR